MLRYLLILVALAIPLSSTVEARRGRPVAQEIELGPAVIRLDTEVTKIGLMTLYLKMFASQGDIHIYIDSPGGDFRAARWLVGKLEQLKKSGRKVHCYGGGRVASAAFYIYLHCDERYVVSGTILFPHKIHILYHAPVLPDQLIRDGTETAAEQQEWDELGIEVTGMSPEDYKEFRDSDDKYWSIRKVQSASKKKWFKLVDSYQLDVR